MDRQANTITRSLYSLCTQNKGEFRHQISYREQESVHPFCESLLLHGQLLLLQRPAAALFKPYNILPLRNDLGVVVVLGHICG